MSTLIMAAVWPLQMPPTPKAVLVSLADNANDQGECWPSIATIGKRTCFSERAVQNAIRWLEESGYLVADRTNGRHTRYTVHANPRTSCTPAAGAPLNDAHPRSKCTPAADAPNPRSTCAAPPQQVPSNRQEPPRTVNPPSPAGAACAGMRLLGVARVNPSNADLLAAFAEGVTVQTLIDTAGEFVAADPDCFAYVIATARKRHARGAKPITGGTTHASTAAHDRSQRGESLVDRAARRAQAIVIDDFADDEPGLTLEHDEALAAGDRGVGASLGE